LPGSEAMRTYLNALAESGESCVRDWLAD